MAKLLRQRVVEIMRRLATWAQAVFPVFFAHRPVRAGQRAAAVSAFLLLVQ